MSASYKFNFTQPLAHEKPAQAHARILRVAGQLSRDSSK